MSSNDREACYRRFYKMRPHHAGLANIFLTIFLCPLLIPLAGLRLAASIVVTGIYIIVPRTWFLHAMNCDAALRLTYFICFGVILKLDISSPASHQTGRLVVANHHGACDLLLLPLMGRLGITRLVTVFTADDFEKSRRWYWLFAHTPPLVPPSLSLISDPDGRHMTLAFPEVCGKQAPVVFTFRPELFWLFHEIRPIAISFRFALPLCLFYGEDLPLSQQITILLMMLSPWTIMTVKELPLMQSSQDSYRKVAVAARNEIVTATGYEAIDFQFDWKGYEKYVMRRTRST